MMRDDVPDYDNIAKGLNEFLKTLLETIAQDANYDTMIVSDAYTKLIGRYNK